MKRLLLLLAIAFSFVNLAAQNQVTDSTAGVIAYWKKGDKAKFSMSQTEEKYADEKLVSRQRITSEIDILIVVAAEKSYTINWKYSNIKIEGAEQSPLEIKLAKLAEGITARYKTDETGAFLTLINWKEIQTFIYTTIDKIGTEFKTPEAKKMLKHLKNVYIKKENVEQLVMSDIQLYHTLYGYEYQLKKKIEISDAYLPNALGGNPIPATAIVQMTQLDPAANTCKIQILQKADSAYVAQAISEWIQKIGATKGDAKKVGFDINDTNEYEIDLQTGWITRATYNRLVLEGNTRRTNAIEMKKI